jgi:hypothetical protein
MTATDGSYRIVSLPLGVYRLEVKAAGFKKYTRTEISLELGRNARIDPKLEIGDQVEELEIVGDAPLVETSNPGLARVVGNAEVLNLTIPDRRIYSLLSLTPGVEMNDFEPAGTFGFTETNVTITGSARAGVDRSTSSSTAAAAWAASGSPARLGRRPGVQGDDQQLLGRAQGAARQRGRDRDQVRYQPPPRVGLPDHFRGERFSAFEWNPTARWCGEATSIDDFGFTLGGPIRKDKTFFFVSYAGLRQDQTAEKDTAVVPTALEREGDYSQSAKKPVDPLTGKPFPGGIVPRDRMDPVALLIQNGDPARSFPQWVPLPQLNDLGNPTSGYRTTYLAQEAQPTTANEVLVKIDHRMGTSTALRGATSTGDRSSTRALRQPPIPSV